MRKTKHLGLALLALTWTAGINAWDEPTQVDGVYQIGTASELEWFAEQVNSVTDENKPETSHFLTAKVVLTADIDMTGIDHTPIGQNSTYKFNGEFDGQFHTISNMVINRPTEDQLGLFGWVRGGTVIKNVIIDETCSVTGNNRVGALIGCVQTNAAGAPLKILNCVSFATLTSAHAAGSMIGAGAEQYPYFEMMNCVNAGKITGQDKGSAFCGWNKSAGGNARMYNCLNIAEISVLDGGNQMFRGANRELANCYDMVHSASNFQGQHPTYTTDDPLHSGELCYLLNNALDASKTVTEGTITFKQDLSDPNSIPMPSLEGKEVYAVANYDCAGNPKGELVYSNEAGGTRDEHRFSDGEPFCATCGAPNEAYKTADAEGFYHLGTVQDVEWFSAMVNKGWHGGMNIKLDNDIDFGGVPNAHQPIGTSAHKYWGHFDGQGHRIKGMILDNDLVLDNPGYDGKGFFGSVRGGGTDNNWGIKSTTPIIENLFIDKTCSITHNQNFAAGVVAHVNATESGVSLIIRNCGNEADVYTTGKQAAGILGCVEATNMGLVLHNLYNTGKITGLAGESAAICAWTGQRNVNGEVDVNGCWNIGEVTGMDANGYNMIRRNSNIVPTNLVDLCATNGGNQGKVTIKTEDPIASGELCYLLNGDQTNITWTQTLGTESQPNGYGNTDRVYQAGTIDCAGNAVGELNYNNESGETIQLGHDISDEIGMCQVCHTQFQEPAKGDDGYYMLKNAGNVEWLSEAVANGGGAEFLVRMENDIDFLGIENLHNPIGPTTGAKFKGVFDGQGHSIRNLIINRPATDYQGFFGFLQGNASATVKNLVIDKSCSFTGKNRIGALAASYQNPGGTITIENIVNEADVTAEVQDAGAIIGSHYGGNPTIIIRNCVNTGTITAKDQYPYAGALCCYLGLNNDKSLIENFLNLGTVIGHNGGNIGRYNATNVTNIIDLSDTEDKTQGVVDGLTAEDITSGRLAWYINEKCGKQAFGQLIGTDSYPSPLKETEVHYVGDAGYATMSSTAGFTINGNAKASIVTGEVNRVLQLREVASVPANTGVVLEGTYYNVLSAATADDCTGNMLVAVAEDMDAPVGSYVLQDQDGRIGFYNVTEGAQPVIKAGKAYLSLASEAKALWFDGATGIDEIADSETKTENAAPIYNMAGQRVQKAGKGIYITAGKKIMY